MNGYIESIMDTESGICFLSGKRCDTVRHEIFFGTGNRALSKKNGCWVNLSPEMHRQVHADRETDLMLKKECYKRFCATRSREEFYRLFRRYYDD